ncbi:MAG: Uncharacterised protein [Methanobacteriota archaeon]|nr:MAG: Uncharacterised protein [Euryarchaeota archaeon]
MRMLFSSSGSSPSKSRTISAEFAALSGHFSSKCSNPTRVSSSGGRASLEAIENSAWKNGNPAPRRIINVGINTVQGRSITVFAILDQIPSSESFFVSNVGILSAKLGILIGILLLLIQFINQEITGKLTPEPIIAIIEGNTTNE